MSIKKPSLAAALHAASGKATPPAVVAGAIAAPPPVTSAREAASAVPPSRAGKKVIAGHFDPAVTRQLKQLALDQESTVQNLLAEALNDLFAKHDKQRIA